MGCWEEAFLSKCKCPLCGNTRLTHSLGKNKKFNPGDELFCCDECDGVSNYIIYGSMTKIAYARSNYEPGDFDERE